MPPPCPQRDRPVAVELGQARAAVGEPEPVRVAQLASRSSTCVRRRRVVVADAVEKPSFISPLTASDGIQETDVRADSTRMAATLGTRGAASRGRSTCRVGGASTPGYPGGPDHLADAALAGRNSARGRHHGAARRRQPHRPRGRARAAAPRRRRRGRRRGRRLRRAGRRRDRAAPQVVVTDIRMPPTFQNEGIEAAKEVRKRQPGTGVVVLSQYDSPEYAVDAAGRAARPATPTC